MHSWFSMWSDILVNFMLNSLRFMISVQLILRFAMKTSKLKENNSNDANDKYSSFNWHQLTYILAFSYSSRGTSHELTPSKVVYQPYLSTSSESINRSTDLNVLRLFDRAVSTAYSSCSGFMSTSACIAYHQKIMDSRCVKRIEDSLMYHIQKTSPYWEKSFLVR